MPKARNILKRAKALKGIHGITRTMEMIAAGRFKKRHDQTVNLRPYTDAMADMVGDLISRGALKGLAHPLLQEPRTNRDVLIVLTSNRGLCGAYNSAVVRLALERMDHLQEADYDVKLHVVGRQGIRQLAARSIRPDVQ